MSVAAQRDTLNSTKLDATNFLITEDPFLISNCQIFTWQACPMVSPRSLQRVVRWESLGTRLLLCVLESCLQNSFKGAQLQHFEVFLWMNPENGSQLRYKNTKEMILKEQGAKEQGWLRIEKTRIAIDQLETVFGWTFQDAQAMVWLH